MGDVTGRAAAQRLGALEAVGHGVERIGEVGGLAVVATGRPGGRLAAAQPARGVGHVTQRSGQPVGHVGGRESDGDDAERPADDQGEIEEREEAAVADPGGQVGRQRGHHRAVDFDRRRVRHDIAIGRTTERRHDRPVGHLHADDPAEARGQLADGDLQPCRPIEPFGDHLGGGVEAGLLRAGEDGLEPAADHAIDDDPGDQEHAEHDRPEQETEAPREGRSTRRRAHAGSLSRPATRRYPTCGMVSISHGVAGSSPSLRRRFATWTSTTRS